MRKVNTEMRAAVARVEFLLLDALRHLHKEEFDQMHDVIDEIHLLNVHMRRLDMTNT